MSKKKKKVSDYFVYGYVKENLDIEFPSFQFSSKSINKICQFVSSIDFEVISIQVVRYYEDGTTNFLDLDLLRSLSDEIFGDV